MSRDRLRHPGPPANSPCTVARGSVRRLSVTLPRGAILLEAVAQALPLGCTCAAMDLSGAWIGPFDYVMPDRSTDGVHAAWYSETHHGTEACLQHATAIVGTRDGAPWLHCHALWGDHHCGHLLPDAVTLAKDADVTLYAFDGGGFDVALCPETLFPIFHVTGGQAQGKALIAKVNPHHDLATTLAHSARDAGFQSPRILGIGSLIGARLAEGRDMTSPISEVLIPGAVPFDPTGGLPMICVDPAGGLFRGTLTPGGAPVCVTFEALILDAD